MQPQHRQNIQRFQDTLRTIKTNPILQGECAQSIQGIQLHHKPPTLDDLAQKGAGTVVVSKKRSFQAAQDYLAKHPKQTVAVLNFASPIFPAAGLDCAYNTQEEVLCRCSTLYPTLNTEPLLTDYYKKHRKAKSPIFSDDCIFTPHVTVFKEDKGETLMPQDGWFHCHILTCAAPCIPDVVESGMRISRGKLDKLLANRAKMILAVAAHHGADALILGAFGCGAFGNDPTQMAQAFHTALENHRTQFEYIEFPIFSPGSGNNEIYDQFNQVLSDLT